MDKEPLQYTHPHQFQPLLPQKDLGVLVERSNALAQQAMQLTGGTHIENLKSLRELVRSMNSYYSNRIEGQSTHPLNIEKALHQDFSKKPDVAQLQRIALAHIDAERELEHRLELAQQSALSSEILLKAHTALYGRLTQSDRMTKDQRIIEPGVLRQEEVAVGKHLPPLWSSLPSFLSTMDKTYSRPLALGELLVYTACQHHRAAWVHPFLDGNGRAVRLQTHRALWPLTGGLWSMNRGLARNRETYCSRLIAADQPRRGDLDGRGNLSEAALSEWCNWFISIAEDQVSFMTQMLNFNQMKSRITALISYRLQMDKKIRKEVILPLHHLFLAGPITRGEFQQMTGLQERTAQNSLSYLIKSGLVTSKNHVAPVELAFPLDALQFLLPDLYPEASTQVIDG